MSLIRLREFLFGTLRGRLIVSVALVHAILMSLFVTDSIIRQRSMYLASQEEDAIRLSQTLSASAAGWLAADDVSGLQELINAESRYPELVFAGLTDGGGRVIAHTDASKVGLFMLDLPKEPRLTVLSRTSNLVDVAMPAVLQGKVVGWSRIGLGQKFAYQKLLRLTIIGALYACVAICIGALIAWIMGRQITARLYVVQETIGNIRSGVGTARARLSGNDEAASIAREFDAMLDTLDERNRTLFATEKNYRSLIENINTAIVVHSSDRRVLVANSTAETLLGLSEAQMLGKEATDPAWKFLREDGSDLPIEEYPVNLAATTCKPIRGMVAGIRRTSGQHPIWVLVNATPILDDAGALHQIVVTFVDITERKRAEEELKQMTIRNEMILNSAGEGIYGTDIHGEILFINAAALAMLGLQSEEAVGHGSHELFHHTRADGRPRPVEECTLHQTLKNGQTYRGSDEVFWRKDCSSFPVELVNTPLVDHGAVVGAVVVFRDITDRKRTEDQSKRFSDSMEEKVRARTADLMRKSDELKDSQRALMNIVEDLNRQGLALAAANEKLKGLDRLKSMFIASMSHELRTPLNSIIGFSSIVLNEWAGPVNAEQKENLTSILRSGKHLLALINDVIDVSKIEAGKLESIFEETDLYNVVNEAVSTVEKDIKDKGLNLNVRVEHLNVRTDRRRLLQCLLNLMSNATKFTQHGTISISATRSTSNGHVDIEVSDTGIGMRQEDLGKLFSPFVRLDSPLRTTVLGTGLGLYLTKKLVTEVLRGDVLVSSAVGRGSRFVLRLPAVGVRDA